MDEKIHKTFFHHWISAYADRLHLMKQGTDDRIEMPASADSQPVLSTKEYGEPGQSGRKPSA